MNASAPKITKAGTLTHRGRMNPFTMTSHWEKRRRRCAREIIEKITTAIVVNGFMVYSTLKDQWVSFV
jgi:hypothetical protein